MLRETFATWHLHQCTGFWTERAIATQSDFPPDYISSEAPCTSISYPRTIRAAVKEKFEPAEQFPVVHIDLKQFPKCCTGHHTRARPRETPVDHLFFFSVHKFSAHHIVCPGPPSHLLAPSFFCQLSRLTCQLSHILHLMGGGYASCVVYYEFAWNRRERKRDKLCLLAGTLLRL